MIAPHAEASEGITVQVGALANAALAHFWNLQLSLQQPSSVVRSAVMARAGGGWVPRAVIVDATDEALFGARIVSSSGEDVAASAAAATDCPPQAWSGAVQTIDRRRSKSSSPQQPKDAAAAPSDGAKDGDDEEEDFAPADQRWGQTLGCALHSRTFCCAAGDAAAADDWGAGDAAAAGDDGAAEAVAEAVRQWAESLDRVSALHCAVDAASAWGAVGSRVLERLRDDYERTPLLALAVSAPLPAERLRACAAHPSAAARWRLCDALAVHSLAPLCSLLVPLHAASSAAVACAVDCVTLPHRLAHGGTSCLADTLARIRWLSRGGLANAAALSLLSAKTPEELLANDAGSASVHVSDMLPPFAAVGVQQDGRGSVSCLQFSRGAASSPLRRMPSEGMHVVECFGTDASVELHRTFPRCAIAGSDGPRPRGRRSAYAALLQVSPSAAISNYFRGAAAIVKEPDVRAAFNLLQSRSLPTAADVADELTALAESAFAS